MRNPRRTVWLAAQATALGVAMALPTSAAGQSTPVASPAAEFGLSLSADNGEHGGATTWGPKLTLHFDRRNALEAGLDLDPDRHGQRRRDLFSVQARRELHRFDRGSVFATAGLAVERNVVDVRPVGDFPGFVSRATEVGAIVGAGAAVEVARHLALRGDAQLVLGDHVFLRGSVGVSVPLRPYPDRSAWRTGDVAASDDPFAGLHPGQHVWLTTTDGRVIEGDAVDRTRTTLSVVAGGGRLTRLAAADLRRLETTDRLRNGLTIGVLSGGIPGAVLGGVVGTLLCESDDPCALGGALVIGGIGAGVGALAGAAIDSLRRGRRTLYERPGSTAGASFGVVPFGNRRGAGAAGVIRW